jgi:DNA-binding NtrC family response regulator
MKLLILDDVKEYVDAMARALRDKCEIVKAYSVKEAKAKMKESIDVALVDIRLSEEDAANRDGVVFLSWSREHYPDVPVIMMSAYRDHDAAVDTLNLGAEYYLKKPINLKELRDIIDKFGK